MPLASGTRFGIYEVVGLLGSGGMGEVYRARDSRLRRDVALKVLPELQAADPERLARFEREAQVLAALSHPNIATIHGVEDVHGGRALVLELVDGPTLEERLRRGSLPADESLRIARQLVDALEAAHASGIIHRDLKPSNIKLRPDGAVKVLDFGLAKALAPVLAASDVPESPTITSADATRHGTILGTAAYMSPEQARGQPVDKRSDIWAFGCLLYEMLTGNRAFAGKDLSETLAFVIMKEPDWTALPADTPPSIRRLLRHSLEKDQRRRLADIADARIEIDDISRDEPVANVEGAARPMLRSRERLAWISLVAVLALVTIAAAVWGLRPLPQSAEMRVDIATPASSDPISFAISPDGQKIVFVATTDGRSQLWLRSLDSASAQPLPGTEDARLPFWSADSRSVGFGADAQLKRIDLDGGSVRGLANAPVFLGGTWNQAGDILFVPNANGSVFRVPAAGGEAVAATPARIGQSHHSPSFLPDGRHFLYYVVGAAALRGIHVAELGKEGTRRLLDADTGGVYGAGDVVLFARKNTAFAQRIDPARLEMVGEAVPVAQNVTVTPFANSLHAGLTASAAGPVLYRTGQLPRSSLQFAWFDRSGRELQKVGDPLPMVLNAALSPDDQRIAAFTNADIWVLDTRRGRAFTRFTFDAAVEFTAIWSPDGSRIVISSNREGPYNLYEKSATGAGTERELLATPQNKDATDWSADGAFLLYRSFEPRRAYDILALRIDNRTTFPVVQTDADERNAQFSPDGRWIAYQSNESGRFEIWVQPFSVPGTERRGKWQISTRGGAQVRWNRNGQELFYLSADGRLMTVPIRITADGQAIETASPQALFPWPGQDFGRQGTVLPPYAVSKDGQRFLFATTPVQTNTSPLTMILNWRRP